MSATNISVVLIITGAIGLAYLLCFDPSISIFTRLAIGFVSIIIIVLSIARFNDPRFR